MDFRITLAIGFGFLVIAGIAFYIPEILHYETEQPKEELGMAHSDSIQVSKIDFNFITRTSPQILYVDYSVNSMNNGSLAIVIPYHGIVDEMPVNWQIKKFSSGSIVLFKNFTCTPISCVDGDYGRIKFNLTEKIDSWRFPNHYVLVPFSSTPSNNEILQFINDLNKSTLPFSFGWNKVSESTLKITIDKEFDEWNTEPVSHLSSIENQNGGRNLILLWNILNDRPIFTVNYSSSKDRVLLFYAQGIMGFGTGIGIGMIIDGVNTRRNEKQQAKLQDFIKIQRYMQDANTAFSLKNYRDAKQYYDLANKIDPKDIDPLLLAGNSFYEMKRFDDAIPYYEKILKLNPKHVGSLNNIGASIAGLGNHPDAIEYYERALVINPNHTDTLNNFGAAILDLGYPDCAIPYFNEVLLLNKNDVTALANKGKSIAVTNHNEAIKYYDNALKIDPNNVQPLTFKALSLYELKQYEEALACWNLILKIDSMNKIAIHNKGTVLMVLDKFEDALLCYDEFLINNPNDSGAIYNKGLCLEQKKEHSKAIGCFSRAIDLGIDDPQLLNNIGKSFVEYGDPNKAITDCFQKILKNNSKNLDALYGMYMAFNKIGNNTEATAWLAEFNEAKNNLNSDNNT